MFASAHRSRELHYFALLDRSEQRAAIVRLSAEGFSDYGIAAATRLSVEFVRHVIGERREVDA